MGDTMIDTHLHGSETDAELRRQWLLVLQGKNEELERARVRIALLEAELEELRAMVTATASQEA